MRKIELLAVFLFTAGSVFAQSGRDHVARQQAEVERVREMVEAGVLPKVRLDEAEAALADARDRDALDRTLYGTIGVEDLTEEQADEMVEAAKRQYARQQEAVEKAKALVDVGARPRMDLMPLLQELDSRRRTLDLAESRGQLLRELAAAARAEELQEEAEAAAPRMAERYDGSGAFHDGVLKVIETAYAKQFGRALPVSAKGATAVHRSLGFDHRGRVDVAVNPDQAEGVWLRKYLESRGIPYFAFRAAVRGKATGAHIHIGPPSLRLRYAD
ncbi:MAG: hypothetical protein SFV54_08210 [Bryobacteraceae bacterium]|nr:hypothetical protein [Bryobacteraceae bacterium]